MRNHKVVLDQELLPDLGAFISKYVALPSKDHELVLAIWVVHTHMFNAANVTPYLYIYSSEPQCGKTRCVEVLSVLARNSRRADDMTAPVMFKIIARECPTLFLDEIDTVWSGSRNEPKRQVLNTGYRRGGSAWREQARELIEFPTFSPKALAGINNGFMPATVRDRCIPIELKRRRTDQTIERFVESRIKGTPELEELLDRLFTFSENHYIDVKVQRPLPMTNLNDRQDEISEPLLAIGAAMGVESELRNSLSKLFAAAGKAQPSVEQVMFGRIRDAFDGKPKIFTEDLCEALGPMYNGRTLALWLEPFQITPKNVRDGNRVMRGYTADQFMEVWSRFLDVADNVDSDTESEAA